MKDNSFQYKEQFLLSHDTLEKWQCTYYKAHHYNDANLNLINTHKCQETQSYG